MARKGNTGVPHLPKRLDDLPTARGENRLIDAVRSLHGAGVERGYFLTRQHICGFEPIALASSSGVGLWPGWVSFQETRLITEDGATERSSEHVMPTLSGTALNAATPPRTALAAGDWTAWLVWPERWKLHSARVEFKLTADGAPSYKRDEKGVKLVDFKVEVNSGRYRVTTYSQYVCDYFHVDLHNHQWKVQKTDTAKIQVEGGVAVWPKGLSDPIVATNRKVVGMSETTITEDGSIWLELNASVSQQSTSNVDLGSAGDVDLINYKINSLSGGTLSFRGATVNPPNPPVAGVDANDEFGSTALHYEIAKLVMDAGEVFVDDQCIAGEIYVPGIHESLIQ